MVNYYLFFLLLLILVNGDGFVSCQEFTKAFLRLGFVERANEVRESNEKLRLAEAERLEKERKVKEELAAKNVLKMCTDYAEQDKLSAIAKLAEAAWKYDKTLPGSPSLAAFDCEAMLPHVFKEQLRSVLGIKLTPKELGALVAYFDRVCYHNNSILTYIEQRWKGILWRIPSDFH